MSDGLTAMFLVSGYAYRYRQGQTASGPQVRPAEASPEDLGWWAKGWVQAEQDIKDGLPSRYPMQETGDGEGQGETHNQGGSSDFASDAGDEPERTTLVGSPSLSPLPSHWLSATIDRTPEGWVLTLDGAVRAFRDPGKGKAPARLLEVLVTEIAKRLMLDETGETLAEIHEKTKGAP